MEFRELSDGNMDIIVKYVDGIPRRVFHGTKSRVGKRVFVNHTGRFFINQGKNIYLFRFKEKLGE